MKRHNTLHAKQRGAALIVGLMLLVIVTLLAVTAMGTANTELVMAGNEQFRERAFQAAESGLEMAIRKSRTGDPDVPMHCGENLDTPGTAIPSEGQDSYNSRLTYIGSNSMVAESSKARGITFAIRSTGSSARNATSVHDGGTWVLGPADESSQEEICPAYGGMTDQGATFTSNL